MKIFIPSQERVRCLFGPVPFFRQFVRRAVSNSLHPPLFDRWVGLVCTGRMVRQGLGEDGGSRLGEGADCAVCDVCIGAWVGDSRGRGQVVQRKSAATNRWVTLGTRFLYSLTN